jgi:hypothetical protein
MVGADKLSNGARPVPFNTTVALPALEAMTRVPDCKPPAVGANLTVTVQEPPGPSVGVAPQVPPVPWMNSAEDKVIEFIVTEPAVPGLPTVTV